MKKDLVIIGGGPAGLAAAIEAKKNGIDDIVIVERDKYLGGILQQCIHNGFGLHVFKEMLTGPEYAERFIKEVETLKIDYMLDTMVLHIDSDKNIILLGKDGLFNIKAKAIILTMGARERTRGQIMIPGGRPSGVFTAGTAQRFINIEGYMVGKKVVILGSGDIGLIMARRLTLEGAKVEMVLEIMPYSTGLKRNIVQCLEDYDIPIYYNHTIVNIHGKERVEGVTVARVDENRKPIEDTKRFVECDTVLLSVGLIPENELSRDAGIQLDNITGGPIVNESMMTSVAGIFACGNVVHIHDLVDNVTMEGQLAGGCAARYIKSELVSDEIKAVAMAGNGIRYVVPQRINLNNIGKNIKFYFRVDNQYENKFIVVKADENEILRVKKGHLTPGEMESVIIPKEKLSTLNSKITIQLEEI